MTLGPDPAWIFHISHIDNLPAILQHGGLYCENEVNRQSLGFKRIGYEKLKGRRAQKAVPIAPLGTLADYVPFYFAPRSPMLFAISKDLVEGYSEGQEPILYLIGKAVDVAKAGLPFAFTDHHAILSYSEYYNDLGKIGEIDWNLMNATYWNETDDDPNRKARRQAEFLVHQRFPLDQIAGIAVMNRKRVEDVSALLNKAGRSIPVYDIPRWYF